MHDISNPIWFSVLPFDFFFGLHFCSDQYISRLRKSQPYQSDGVLTSLAIASRRPRDFLTSHST